MQSSSDESSRSGGGSGPPSSTLRQLVFATIAEGVVLMDASGTIVDWNPAAERIFGYSREEMIGRKPDVYRHPEIVAELEVEIGAALEREGHWSGEVRFVRKDGEEGISEAAVSVQYDATGARVGLVGVHRDITRRKREEEVLRRRGEAAPVAEDGGRRPAGGRHRARLQQPADGDPRVRRPAAGAAAPDKPVRAETLEEIGRRPSAPRR